MKEYISMFKRGKGTEIEQVVIHIGEREKLEKDGYVDHVDKLEAPKKRRTTKAKAVSNDN